MLEGAESWMGCGGRVGERGYLGISGSDEDCCCLEGIGIFGFDWFSVFVFGLWGGKGRAREGHGKGKGRVRKG